MDLTFCGTGYLKHEQEHALKQLYDGKDVAVLPPGFGKDCIYQAQAKPTRWRNISCHCSVEELIEPLKTRDWRAACRPLISQFLCCCIVRAETEHCCALDILLCLAEQALKFEKQKVSNLKLKINIKHSHWEFATCKFRAKNFTLRP